MDEEEKEQVLELLEKNIEFLKKNVPPDDIYLVAELNFTTALFFLKRWSELENIEELCKKDEDVHQYVTNVMNFLDAREKNGQVKFVGFGLYNDSVFEEKE